MAYSLRLIKYIQKVVVETFTIIQSHALDRKLRQVSCLESIIMVFPFRCVQAPTKQAFPPH